METSIYDLKLHETTNVKIMNVFWSVTRVASGWIYQNGSPHIITPVGFFVPFDNKFQETE